jgi:threonine/homoserine/homoserine lactone efflux protein
LLTFLGAALLLIITPGPGVLSLAGVGSAFGFRAGIKYFIGLFVGNNLVGFFVISGLGALLIAEPNTRTIFIILSSSYLVYLAGSIAFSGSKIRFKAYAITPGIKSGILLQIINPKAYVVNSTMYSGFLLFENAYLFEVVIKVLIVNAIWLPVHALWLSLGVLIKRLDLSSDIQRLINYFMAVSMISVVVLAAIAAL